MIAAGALLQKWCPCQALLIGRDMKQIKLLFVPFSELIKHWTRNVKSSLILIKQNLSLTLVGFCCVEKSGFTRKAHKHCLAHWRMNEGWSWESYVIRPVSHRSSSIVGLVGWSLKRNKVDQFPVETRAFQISQDLTSSLGAQ